MIAEKEANISDKAFTGSRPIRILHVINTARAEGTPRLVLDWLTERDEAVQGAAFLFSEPADLRAEFERTGIWVRWRVDTSKGLHRAISIVRFTKQIVKEFEPDLVICWPIGMSSWVLIGSRLSARCGFVTHAGNPPAGTRLRHYVHTYFTYATLTLLDGRIAACSRYIKTAFLGMGCLKNDRIQVIYNAIDARRFVFPFLSTDARKDRQTIVMVGTLEGHKDQPTLIRAIRVLKDREIKIKCVLVGEGSRRTEFATLISELGLDADCELLGSRDDVPRLLSAASVFVLATTHREGRPGVILEALAAGLPVVATDVAPCREVLEEGRWGRLTKAYDPPALAGAIEEQLKSPLTLERQNSQRAYVAGFTVSAMIREYLALGNRTRSVHT